MEPLLNNRKHEINHNDSSTSITTTKKSYQYYIIYEENPIIPVLMTNKNKERVTIFSNLNQGLVILFVLNPMTTP